MREHTISIVGGTSDESGVLTASRSGDVFELKLAFRDRLIQAAGDDYFDAFCKIRRELEADSLMPSCYGTSLNVYPSRMSRQMAGGTVAYKLELGKQAEQTVRIFESGPDMVLASVDEQRTFYTNWLASLGA